MDKLRKIFAAAMICLVVFSIIVYALTTTYHMIGTVSVTKAEMFSDLACTQTIDPVLKNWGLLANATQTIPIWIKNTGTANLTSVIVSLVGSATGCTVNISGGSLGSLTVGENKTCGIQLSAMTETSLSWDLHLDY